MDQVPIFYNKIYPLTEQEEAAARQCASARMLRMVTMVSVTRLVWARTLSVAAEMFVARLVRCATVEVVARLAQCARSGRCSWRLATIIILAPHPK